MKTCSKCERSKPLSEYYRHPTGADGYMKTCKSCKKAYSADRRESLPPEVTRQYSETYWNKFPNKRKAHIIVGNAVRDGRLEKVPCEICGTNKRLHAHHDDYDKPLNVRWLCIDHHKEWHVAHGEALNP